MPTEPTPAKIDDGTENTPTPSVFPMMILMAENVPSLLF
jgi:hypothetical protein